MTIVKGIQAVFSTFRSKGFCLSILHLITGVYRQFIRPVLPSVRPGTCNGVRVPEAVQPSERVFDSLIPRSVPSKNHEYEAELINGLRLTVRKGDAVGVIGGGRGVSSVVAAQNTGSTESVYVYEASKERLDIIEETADLNGHSSTIVLYHAYVGGSGEVYEAMGDVEIIKPAELPAVDVLEIDCEGGELDVLEGLRTLPRAIIVEVHPNFGVSEASVNEWLEKNGYEMIERGLERADPEIPVLTAIQK